MAAPQMVVETGERAERTERSARRVLLCLGVGVVGAATIHAGLMFWARHEFTQAESVVAFHAANLASGRGLYYDFHRYPFTVSPYTPCFYLLSAGLHRLGVAVPLGGRLISFAALLAVVALSWRILRLCTASRYAAWVGTLLVASTGNLLFWGTVGQVDLLALAFSLAAFYQYLNRRLVWAGLLLTLGVFTKQSMLAAGASILLLLALENRRRAAWFALLAGVPGVALALGLNHFTEGRFFDNTIWSHNNPFSWTKFLAHAKYLLLAAGGLVVIVLSGVRRKRHGFSAPLLVYLTLAAAVLALTGSKIGSDLNYQLETMVLLGLCAALTLDRLHFFEHCFRRDWAPVTLLQIPVLLHLVVNLAVSGRLALYRVAQEFARRQEFAQLQPYLRPGTARVLSVQLDPLLRVGRTLEVEPLIYTLLVDAGLADPEPVRRDLAEKKFDLVILYEDLFRPTAGLRNPELPSLPESHLSEIRRHYRLVAHVPGALLEGDYLYRPVEARAGSGEPLAVPTVTGLTFPVQVVAGGGSSARR